MKIGFSQQERLPPVSYDLSHKALEGSFTTFDNTHTTKFKNMKSLILFTLLAGSFAVSCKKEPQEHQTNSDTIMASDSLTSGSAQISPDSADQTATVDSSAYDVDSIKKSR